MPFMSLDKGCKKPLPGKPLPGKHPGNRMPKSMPRNPGAIISEKRQDGDDPTFKILMCRNAVP